MTTSNLQHINETLFSHANKEEWIQLETSQWPFILVAVGSAVGVSLMALFIGYVLWSRPQAFLRYTSAPAPVCNSHSQHFIQPVCDGHVVPIS